MKLEAVFADGGYKNTYAILRALKKEDLKIGILYNSILSLSFFSRYVDRRYLIKTNLLQNPSPAQLSFLFLRNFLNLKRFFLMYSYSSYYHKATTYYIDAHNGNDTNDGKFSKTAWKIIQ